MQYFFENLNWMAFNVTLAIIGLILSVLAQKKYPQVISIFIFIFWFLFLPNTIYLVSDLMYYPNQFLHASGVEQILLFCEYLFLFIFGVLTYLHALKPAHIIIKKLKIPRKKQKYYYIALHCVVAFGVILGKTQRTHSWYVFTDPLRVVRDAKTVLFSPTLVLYVLIFCFIIYVLLFILDKYKIFQYPTKNKK